jgi:hypothetical protein
VISLKNFCEDTRVIIQLMMYHNKAYLLNIPGRLKNICAIVSCLSMLFVSFKNRQRLDLYLLTSIAKKIILKLRKKSFASYQN